MGHGATMETQRARLAHRLRPLYVELRSDEFDRMVARIAEIELSVAAAEMPDGGGGSLMRRAQARVVQWQAMPS